MQVRCIRLINPITGENESHNPHLTIGRTYVVLTIEIGVHRHLWFRLIGDDSPSPILEDTQQFEIVDGRLPSRWIVWSDGKGFLMLAPQSWTYDGFWEQFFNNDEYARQEFRKEHALIINETG